MSECVSPPSFLKSIFVVNILNGYGPGGARGWVWFGPTTLSTWQFKSSLGWLVVSKYFSFQAFLQEIVGLTKCNEEVMKTSIYLNQPTLMF